MDADYEIKISDFAFAAPSQGKDGSGILKTKLGTRNYMAPEIHAGKDYYGPAVDSFAACIMCFMMLSAHYPFHKATPIDRMYMLIYKNHSEKFWAEHEKLK